MGSWGEYTWEEKGIFLYEWMGNAGFAGSRIKKGTLTLPYLGRDSWTIINDENRLSNEQCRWIKSLDLPPNVNDQGGSPYRTVLYIRSELPAMTFSGRTGPGIIFVEVIRRKAGNEFHISDLMKLAYEQDFPLCDLKYIFVETVINTDTSICYQDICQRHGINFLAAATSSWDWKSQEFKTLLGCGIGKAMASFILCAFGQGVKRIEHIMLWREDRELNMRFDIENIN